jgi:pimeloyl-ACP methyl ester carboxylesterase
MVTSVVMGLPERRTVVLHGHRVSYLIAGSEAGAERSVLILVHGIAGSSATWEALLPLISERCTVIAPDLLGHGESDKPRHDYSLGAHANGLRDLMIALGIERATLVGHSFGGGVAMQFAYQHPERCERLALVSSGGLGSEVSWILRAMTLPGAEYLMPVLFPSYVRDLGNGVSRWLRRLGLRVPNIEEQWRSYVTLTEPANRHTFVHTLRSVVDVAGQTVSAHDRLYLASRLPTLIIWGRRDHIIPVGHAHAAHEALPGSRLEIFDESGHFPHTEKADDFVAVLNDFVETTEPMHLDVTEWQDLLGAGRPTQQPEQPHLGTPSSSG